MWQPDTDKWRVLVAHCLGLPPVQNITIPHVYARADVIYGPVSQFQNMGKVKSQEFPEPGEQMQFVTASYKSCERLAASLKAIIYFDHN